MNTLKELYLYAKKELKEKEQCEALMLTEAFLKAGRREISLYGEKIVPKNEKEEFLNAVKMRKENIPLQYITGYQYFGDMKLKVGEGVLIPREDTLPLCEVAAEFTGDKAYKGIDLCSGSGAIALYIANECKNAEVYAMELYEGAKKYLRENIKTYGEGRVKLIEGDVNSRRLRCNLVIADCRYCSSVLGPYKVLNNYKHKEEANKCCDK